MRPQWRRPGQLEIALQEDAGAHARRYLELRRAFRRWRSAQRVGLARAPGRVNLIGEHPITTTARCCRWPSTETWPGRETMDVRSSPCTTASPAEKRLLPSLLMPSATWAHAAFRIEGVKLDQRLRHVLGECERVEAMAAALTRGDVAAAGELMLDSHTSCRDLYEISTPEVDRLVGIALEAGALGARITGAGFGGCTIFLVPVSRTE